MRLCLILLITTLLAGCSTPAAPTFEPTREEPKRAPTVDIIIEVATATATRPEPSPTIPTTTAAPSPTAQPSATKEPTATPRPATNTPRPAPTNTLKPKPTATPRPVVVVAPTLPPSTWTPVPVVVVPTATDAPPQNCDPAYPTVCIPPPPPDLDCKDIPYRKFTVLPPDPHGFDGKDNDGIGCES